MKITRLQTILVEGWVFVKVHTDEPGLVGLGEGTVGSKGASVAAAIEDMERMLVGRDPLQIEGLWQMMYRGPRWRGGPILCSAISAIDIALWDIKGKEADRPIYQLLGGACRDRVRLYAHANGPSPRAAAENALHWKEQGFTAAKTGPLQVVDGVIRLPESLIRGVAKIQAMRDAVGDGFDILIDAHGQLTPTMAVEYAERVKEYRPMFLEECTQPEDLDALAWLAARVQVPLATGERLFTKWGFSDLCHRHLVNYIQPDVVHCGGITELKKIGTLAEAHFIEMAPHHAQSWVSGMASVHIDACTPASVIQEFPAGPEWQSDLFASVPNIQDGYAELPTQPGLGLELNEAVARRRPYKPQLRTGWRWPDGAVADN